MAEHIEVGVLSGPPASAVAQPASSSAPEAAQIAQVLQHIDAAMQHVPLPGGATAGAAPPQVTLNSAAMHAAARQPQPQLAPQQLSGMVPAPQLPLAELGAGTQQSGSTILSSTGIAYPHLMGPAPGAAVSSGPAASGALSAKDAAAAARAARQRKRKEMAAAAAAEKAVQAAAAAAGGGMHSAGGLLPGVPAGMMLPPHMGPAAGGGFMPLLPPHGLPLPGSGGLGDLLPGEDVGGMMSGDGGSFENLGALEASGGADASQDEKAQRRMIKNRESAARSRARRQEYTASLEATVAQLREQNRGLRTQVVMVAQAPADPHAGKLDGQTLRRTRTTPL